MSSSSAVGSTLAVSLGEPSRPARRESLCLPVQSDRFERPVVKRAASTPTPTLSAFDAPAVATKPSFAAVRKLSNPTDTDLAAVDQINAGVVVRSVDQGGVQTAVPWSRYRADKMVRPGRDLFLIDHDGKTAGYACVSPNESLLTHIAVDPEAQGQGLGTQLLRGVLARYTLPVTLHVRGGSSAVRLYDSMVHHGYDVQRKDVGVYLNGNKKIEITLTRKTFPPQRSTGEES